MLVALFFRSAAAQGAPAFEVATVKPAARLDATRMMEARHAGGKMPIGAHVGVHSADYLHMNLKSLIVHAWQVKSYQVLILDHPGKKPAAN